MRNLDLYENVLSQHHIWQRPTTMDPRLASYLVLQSLVCTNILTPNELYERSIYAIFLTRLLLPRAPSPFDFSHLQYPQYPLTRNVPYAAMPAKKPCVPKYPVGLPHPTVSFPFNPNSTCKTLSTNSTAIA